MVEHINNSQVMERRCAHDSEESMLEGLCAEPTSSVRLQLENLGKKWPRYGPIVSPDNRNTNLRDTCLDDVKNMSIMWWKGMCWKDPAGKHEYGESQKVVLTKKDHEEVTQMHKHIVFHG